jgi:hypothetical protein
MSKSLVYQAANTQRFGTMREPCRRAPHCAELKNNISSPETEEAKRIKNPCPPRLGSRSGVHPPEFSASPLCNTPRGVPCPSCPKLPLQGELLTSPEVTSSSFLTSLFSPTPFFPFLYYYFQGSAIAIRDDWRSIGFNCLITAPLPPEKPSGLEGQTLFTYTALPSHPSTINHHVHLQARPTRAAASRGGSSSPGARQGRCRRDQHLDNCNCRPRHDHPQRDVLRGPRSPDREHRRRQTSSYQRDHSLPQPRWRV